jgi:hypothetical protein
MLAAARATPIVQTMLNAAEAANCHHETAPKSTRSGIANGAVGGK